MIILIAGGSCSGKTTLAHQFTNASIVSMDDFFVGKSHMKQPYNFDVPQAVALDELYRAVLKLKRGKSATIPTYSMAVSERIGKHIVKPKKIIVAEGIFVLNYKPLRDIADLKIYLHTPTATRIQRRILRDTIIGRDTIATLKHSITVEEMHTTHIDPGKKFADIIVTM